MTVSESLLDKFHGDSLSRVPLPASHYGHPKIAFHSSVRKCSLLSSNSIQNLVFVKRVDISHQSLGIFQSESYEVWRWNFHGVSPII
jgi:hypothetical protein